MRVIVSFRHCQFLPLTQGPPSTSNLLRGGTKSTQPNPMQKTGRVIDVWLPSAASSGHPAGLVCVMLTRATHDRCPLPCDNHSALHLERHELRRNMAAVAAALRPSKYACAYFKHRAHQCMANDHSYNGNAAMAVVSTMGPRAAAPDRKWRHLCIVPEA